MFKILKKLKNKNHQDVSLRLKKIFFQKKIQKKIQTKGVSYYYTDKFLLKNIKSKNTKEFITEFKNSKVSLFTSVLLDFSNKEVVESADKILNHRFDLLGSGDVEVKYNQTYRGLGEYIYNNNNNNNNNNSDYKVNIEGLDKNYIPIDWNVDFKTGYKWNGTEIYSKVRASPLKKGVDIKLPWELSRCQHFGVLGVAYKSTLKLKYANEIKNQILDWINNNPYCCGPNWECAMDVGIRASNWLMAIDLTKNSEVYDDDFFTLFLKSINHHFIYLINNLEWSSNLTSNHYLSDIAGLFFITSYAQNFKKSQKWFNFSLKEFEKEIFVQTYKDGMNSEGSTSYHRLVLEMFAYCYILDFKNKRKFSKKYKDQLSKMFEFSLAIMKKNGTIPQIGDNDSGVFFRFKNRELIDHSYLASLYNFIEPNNNSFHSYLPESNLFNSQKVNKNYAIDNENFSFKNAGLFIYKTNDLYISIYNGLNGQKGNGGHAHNDKLSFTLDFKGESIFIDPGTYLYTPIPEERNKFRSTFSHNTVGIENFEQNRYFDDYLFSLKEDCKDLKSEFTTNNKGFKFKGSHDGYSRISNKLIHSREFNFFEDENKLIINDFFEDNNYLKKASFIVKKSIIRSIKNNKIKLIFGFLEFFNATNIIKEDFYYSKAYGEINTTDYVRIEVQFNQNLKSIIQLES